jgi:hypothetical protein
MRLYFNRYTYASFLLVALAAEMAEPLPLWRYMVLGACVSVMYPLGCFGMNEARRMAAADGERP